MSPVSPALVVGFIMTSTTCISCACLATRVQQSATLWTASSVNWGFSRQEYWNGLPYPPLGDLPNPGIKPRSPTVQVDSLPSEPPRNPRNTGVGSLSILRGVLHSPGIEPGSPALQMDSLPSKPPGKPYTFTGT